MTTSATITVTDTIETEITKTTTVNVTDKAKAAATATATKAKAATQAAKAKATGYVKTIERAVDLEAKETALEFRESWLTIRSFPVAVLNQVKDEWALFQNVYLQPEMERKALSDLAAKLERAERKLRKKADRLERVQRKEGHNLQERIDQARLQAADIQISLAGLKRASDKNDETQKNRRRLLRQDRK